MSLNRPHYVVLTRPMEYLGSLEREVSQRGYIPIVAQTLDFIPCTQKSIELRSILQRVTDIVFVSRAAVDFGLPVLKRLMSLDELCQRVSIYAMGHQSVLALEDRGVPARAPLMGVGARALFQRAEFDDMTNRPVLIVRGEHGLDWPAQELSARGAQVNQWRAYRQQANSDFSICLQSKILSPQSIISVFLHSAMSAQIALDKWPKDLAMPKTLVAGSDRISTTIRRTRWRGQIEIADSPSNDDMLACLVAQSNNCSS